MSCKAAQADWAILYQYGVGEYGGWGGAYSNGQVVAASKFSDLSYASEGSTHDNRLVTVFLVVVEDSLDTLDTRVLLLCVFLLGRCFEPVKDAAYEGGDKESASLGSSDGLDEGEHEGQVAVDAMLGLKDLGGLDAFPCRCDFDKNTILGDTLILVQLHSISAHLSAFWIA